MQKVTKGLSTVYLYMMQYQEVILEPLLDCQTMPKNGDLPIALHYTLPNV